MSSCFETVRMPWELAGKDPGTPVLLALSGGADSRFLLEVLAKGAQRDGFPILLAHVHHGIRKETADRDCAFCRELAGEYRLPIEVLRADVPQLARESGKGLEEEAREVRYAFFDRLMRERSIPLLVTAHQADDLLETMLFRLARGTGGAGLASIAETRPFSVGYLTRPLLHLTAAEIRRACLESGLRYVEDETNSDTSYARNRIRHEIVPALESLFPEPQLQAVRLSERLRTDESFFQEQVDLFFQNHSEDSLSCGDLNRLHPAIRSRVFIRWLENLGYSPDYRLLARLEDLLRGENGRSVSLSRAVNVIRFRDCLKTEPSLTEPVSYRIPFRKGTTSLPGGITVTPEGQKTTKVHNLSTEFFLYFPTDSVMIEETCYWRERKDGDSIFLGGHHRSLRRLWREAGISPKLRQILPVLCRADDTILWAPFVGFASVKKAK